MPIRMGGLQSGMDTESIIKMMMDAELQPVNRQEDKIKGLNDDLYGWNTMDKALTELGTISNDLTSLTTWSQKTTTSTDETKIVANAERTAVEGTYRIEVSQLALAHSVKSTSLENISSGSLADINNADQELVDAVGNKFKINGQEIEIEEGDTLRELALKINVASASLTNDSVPSFKAMIVDKTLILESGDEGIGNSLQLEDVDGTFLQDLGVIGNTTHLNHGNETEASVADQVEHKITSNSILAMDIEDINTELNLDGTFNIDDGNGVNFDITIDSSFTLEQLKDKINTDATTAGAGVKASLVDNRLVIESTSGTYDKTISLSDTTGDVLDSLGFLSNIDEAQETRPQNLEGTVNGIDITSTSNTGVTSIINGVSMDFYSTTSTNSPVTVMVKNETEGIKDKLNDFIDKYNEVMELANQLGSVQLTDDGDVSAMGLLQGDFLISEIQTKSRTILTQVNKGLGDDFNSLNDIGIYTYGQENKLKLLDEDKLNNALDNNFDDVKDMFRTVNYEDGEATNKGILREFDDYMSSLTRPLTGRISMKTEALNTSVSDKQKWIVKKKNDLKNYESYLWEHFADMETSMASIQNGGAYMLQTLGMA